MKANTHLERGGRVLFEWTDKQVIGFLEIQTQIGSNELLFILTWTHSMQIFREMPFIKPQNDT